MNFVQSQTYNSTINKTHRLLGSVFAEIEFIKNLKFKTQYGYDLMVVNYFDWSDPRSPGSTLQNVGGSVRDNTDVRVFNMANTLTYNFNLKEKHNFNVLLGQEVSEERYIYMEAYSRQFPSYQLHEVSLGAIPVATQGSSAKSRLSSLLLRLNIIMTVNISCRGRYVVTVLRNSVLIINSPHSGVSADVGI